MNALTPPRRAADGAAAPSLPGVTFLTTEGLPRHRQFEAWRDIAVPYLDVGAPAAGATAGFDARAASLRFGPFLFYAASVPPYDCARSAARIRGDSLDHWMIAICGRGSHRQRSGDSVLACHPGIPYVLSMARAFEAQRAGAQVEWMSLHVARDAVPELEAALSRRIEGPLDSATGMLLSEFLAGLRNRLGALQAADLPHLATATQALLAAALHSTGGAGSVEIEQVQLARLRQVIRENLGAATLRPARLAVLAGMSRSQLYRLFEPLGGVAHHIQRERLRAARRLLSNPAERRDIATLAEAAGFFDPSSFSRAFRREFGCTPREFRLATAAGGAMAGTRPAPEGMLALLRDL